MFANVLETIGSPLVAIDGPDGAHVAAKLEGYNPGGSAKIRPALAMVRAAEENGRLSSGDRIVEATSGNTGIGLAIVCAVLGYDLTIVMPSSKSAERRRIMAAYGTTVELVDGKMTAARERATELSAEGDEDGDRAVHLGQFSDPANPSAHYHTTGEEIVEAIGDYSVDAFVAAVGTGGTLTGVGRRLREEFPEVEIVAVEPERNPVLSTGESGSDDYQGMGPGFVSENLDVSLIDDVETVALEDAEAECRRLARQEGILVGQSGGAASLASRRVAERLARFDVSCPPIEDSTSTVPRWHGRTDGRRESVAECPLVVTVFADSGERYLTTGTFE